MEWRVSWAALWAALMCDMPTRNTSEAPTNRQTAPAVTRCETLRDWVDDITMAMDTLRATDFIWGFHPGSCAAGLLTSRVAGSGRPSRFPKGSPVACLPSPRRSQLRGQSRQRPLLGRPSRVPCSASGLGPIEAPDQHRLAGKGLFRQLKCAAVWRKCAVRRRQHSGFCESAVNAMTAALGQLARLNPRPRRLLGNSLPRRQMTP